VLILFSAVGILSLATTADKQVTWHVTARKKQKNVATSVASRITKARAPTNFVSGVTSPGTKEMNAG
jgi:hypothetical protein